MRCKQVCGVWLVVALATAVLMLPSPAPAVVYAGDSCGRPFISVGLPLNDLGAGSYVRMDGVPTNFNGGLYPGGSNNRPVAHTAAGLALASQIVPLDVNGDPAADGRIVMISVGMSNTAAEYQAFVQVANMDPEVAPLVALVNGAQAGQTAPDWTDPNAPTWDVVDQRLASGSLTPEQVQVAWVKQVRIGGGDFPTKTQTLQDDLEAIARALKIRYPHVTLAYFSSRTRAYDTMYDGLGPDLSPEPVAFESGFAVKWLVEKQMSGDPSLNFDPDNGPVMAPWLSWGPYLWIDGENPRSDGRTWLQADLAPDCTHPSEQGEQQVANMLLAFFKTDSTTIPWFLAEGVFPYHLYLPAIQRTG